MKQRHVRIVMALCVAALVGCGDDGGAEGDGTADVAPGADAAGDTTPDTDDEGLAPAPGPDVAENSDDEDADAPCPAGTPCGDGDPCVVCEPGGSCAGEPLDCDDGLECTADSCGADGCVNTLTAGWCLDEEAGAAPVCVENLQPRPSNDCEFCKAQGGQPATWALYVSGAECEDGDLCTVGDQCDVGTCKPGSAKDCSSANPCVETACDPAEGCVETPTDATCDDGDVCTEGDACEEGACQPGEPVTCDDGDVCTLDVCDPVEGCVFTPDSKCDDDDPCTADTCLPDGTCSNEPFSGPCEDGDLCTGGEVCEAGACTGGEPLDCDDANPCTQDSCDPAHGCLNEFLDVACDDGFWCTVNDTCVSGQCIGVKNGCMACITPATSHALKVTEMLLSADGHAGSGLDVDGNPETCAPEGDCSGGVDNALAVLAGIINTPFSDSFASGAVFYVVDMDAATFDGAEFPMAVYDSDITQDSLDAGCDWQAEECSYVPSQFSFGPGCSPYFGLPNATIVGSDMEAGGKGYSMTIALALGGGTFIPITLMDARVEATVSYNVDQTEIVALQGHIAGAAPKQQIIDSIEALPPQVLPVDKDAAITLLELLVENDLDLDGNGENDAASVALRVQAIPADLE